MAQTAEGALKIAARRAGVGPDEYLRRTRGGWKWCTAHQAWHRATVFGADASRGDGRAASCAQSRRRAERGAGATNKQSSRRSTKHRSAP